MRHVFSLFIRARERMSRLTAKPLPIFSILFSNCPYQPTRAAERTTDAVTPQEPVLNTSRLSAAYPSKTFAFIVVIHETPFIAPQVQSSSGIQSDALSGRFLFGLLLGPVIPRFSYTPEYPIPSYVRRLCQGRCSSRIREVHNIANVSDEHDFPEDLDRFF